jgi:phosphoglycerol transferase MdoB-like AlkP superfamily enzyme
VPSCLCTPIPVFRTTPLLLRVLAWAVAVLFPLPCLLLMDYMNYSGQLEQLQSFWEKHPGSVLFSALVLSFLYILLCLLFGTFWPSAFLLGLTSVVCAYVNYTKVALNGDNFYPQDLGMLSQAGDLTSFLSGGQPRWFWPGAALLLVCVLLLFVTRLSLPLPFFFRWSLAGLLVLLAHLSVCTPERTQALLGKFGMSSFDSALQSSNYSANGFVGAFTLNLLNLGIHPPAGYSQSTMEALLSDYTSVPMDLDSPYYDVVVVLSESFFDPRVLPDVTFSSNPLTHYDQLLEDPNCQSGMLYTTAVGGGTVRPEFSILTGLTTDYLPNVTTPYWYVQQEVSSYVSNYQKAGYHTVALHPYDKKFYSRQSAYPLLGFDAFYGQDEFSQFAELTWKRNYISDHTTTQAIQTVVDASEEPIFLFAITMENHQPYNALPAQEISIQVQAPHLSSEALTPLTTYVQGLYDADQMLGELVDWMNQRERPTVLVFFGDHLPTLGANHLAYQESGLIDTTDGLDSEELQFLYSTPFLIYSNRTLSPGLLPSQQGNQLSDYNLLNTLAHSTGMARTPYMELLAQFFQVTPYYNIRLGLPETQAISSFTQAMELVTYDRLLGEQWSAD